MKHRKHLFSAWSWAPGLAVLTAVLLAMPARAQTTVSADAGLGQYYKSQHWVPVPITLTNQGAPARVEVRARFSQGTEGVQEYRIPERVLQNNANERHVLYMKGPRSYAAQTLVVELYREGRLLNVVRPRLALVNQPEWLVYGVGPPEFTAALNLMSTVTQTRPPGSLGMMGNGMMGGMPGVATGVPQPARINVGLVEPAAMPDRWHGFDAADMVVLGPASERDFTPDQLAALRDYVSGGGTLVITGGVNWNRLSAPFFADLLPVRVTGAGTLSSATGLRKLGAAGNRPASLPAGAFAVSVGAPKAGATVEASEGGTPLVVSGRKGSGRVLFLAFDPAQPPFREWAGTRDLWKNLLTGEEGAAILPAIAASEEVDPNWYSGGMSPRGQTRLADAPYSIPQLDIPAFYIVALFLLAYIIVLVPVNYFVL
ncbi:MAG TPA: hypothetical protein VK689_11665, partial [Armatimonadota bacterium]|nr:hypothetical protein [Armatimonadota bacterium]